MRSRPALLSNPRPPAALFALAFGAVLDFLHFFWNSLGRFGFSFLENPAFQLRCGTLETKTIKLFYECFLCGLFCLFYETLMRDRRGRFR